MDLVRHRIAEQFAEVAGHHDDPSKYGGPAGDPGLLGPDSISWEINGDLASVAHAGVAAIILEILHPSVIAGVEQLSDYRQDPLRRSRTTLEYVLLTTFGNTEAASGLIARVRAIHGHINGHRPDGVAFAASDPELLTWVHTCIPWMIMTTFERTNRALSPEERDRYLAEQAVIGRMGGGADIPESTEALAEYTERMRGQLAVTEQTRGFLEFMLAGPAVEGLPRVLDAPLQRFYVTSFMGLAPRWAQDLTGLRHGSPAGRIAASVHLQASARTLRWGFGTPPHVAMARERAEAVPAAPPKRKRRTATATTTPAGVKG